jgi:hypothetical protein
MEAVQLSSVVSKRRSVAEGEVEKCDCKGKKSRRGDAVQYAFVFKLRSKAKEVPRCVGDILAFGGPGSGSARDASAAKGIKKRCSGGERLLVNWRPSIRSTLHQQGERV